MPLRYCVPMSPRSAAPRNAPSNPSMRPASRLLLQPACAPRASARLNWAMNWGKIDDFDSLPEGRPTMLTQTLIYVLQTVFGGFVLAVLTRFFAQALHSPFPNPLAQFMVRPTDLAGNSVVRLVHSANSADA